jgi:ribonuclease P protein component
MLPPEHRLRSSRDFQRVYRFGRSWAHPLAVLHVAPRPEAEGIRIGFSVSRKVGKAVRRNRAKRRLRELVRARLAARSWRPGFDAIFVARPGADKADISALAAAIDELAGRARLPIIPEDDTAVYVLPASGRGRNGPGSRPRRSAPGDRAGDPAGEGSAAP